MVDPTPLSARVASVIERRLDDPAFGVASLARILCLSRSWLHRRLVEKGGPPPGVRIRRARLERAARLLLSTDRPVGEVAAAVGYRDPAHFTRSFKRAYGVAPTDYRTAETPQETAANEPGQQNGKSPRRPFNRVARDAHRLK